MLCSRLSKRFDSSQLLALLSLLPEGEDFVLVQIHPFVYLGNYLRWGLAAYHTVEHADGTLVFAVGEVDVWRIVVTPVETDDDSKEFTNFRHNLLRFIVLTGAKLVKKCEQTKYANLILSTFVYKSRFVVKRFAYLVCSHFLCYAKVRIKRNYSGPCSNRPSHEVHDHDVGILLFADRRVKNIRSFVLRKC